MKKITIFLSALILTACGDSSQVKQVKDHVYDYIDSTLTVGNALDNRAICNKTNWDSYKDERGRDIVEYTCEFKVSRPNQFLNQTFSGAVGNLNAQLVDKEIVITPENYQKFIDEEKRNARLKYPNYTIYKNHISADAQGFIKAKAQLMIYDKLKQALHEAGESDSFHRYKENREYLLTNKSFIESVLDKRQNYYYRVTMDDIYGEKKSLVGNYQVFFDKNFSSYTKHEEWSKVEDATVRKKFFEVSEDIIAIGNILKENNLLFHDDFYSRSGQEELLKIEYGFINLNYCNNCREIYTFFLEGAHAKNMIYGKEKVSFENYQELLSYLEQKQNDIVKSFVEEVIDPYNQNLTNEIERFEKFSKDIKTESYQQKIKWALIGEREPSLMSCELEFKADGYSSVKSDSGMTSSCFQAAYKSDYVDQIYNQPIMNFINQVTR